MSPLAVRSPTDDQVDDLRRQLADQVEKNSRLADRCIALHNDKSRLLAAQRETNKLLAAAGDEMRAMRARLEANEIGGGA